MKNFIQKYKHAWILSYAFIYVPWFLYLEKTVTTNFYNIHVKWDNYIPFNEYFIIPYLLWFLYVSVTILYFFFTNKQDYYKLCTFLFIGMTISLIICTLFPNGTDLRQSVDPQKNLCAKLVSILHSADTSNNIFPSIHAFNSIGVHLAVTHSKQLRKHPLIRTASLILMIAICFSTVCLKQHSIVDIFGSIIMSYALYPFVYGTIYAHKWERVHQNALNSKAEY